MSSRPLGEIFVLELAIPKLVKTGCRIENFCVGKMSFRSSVAHGEI